MEGRGVRQRCHCNSGHVKGLQTVERRIGCHSEEAKSKEERNK